MTDAKPRDRRRALHAYIDGFNLYHGIHARWGRKYLWLDVVALVQSLRSQSCVERVRYFTAPVLDDPEAASRQSIYLRALAAANPGVFELVQGRYQRKTVTCFACSSSRIVYEEKETDVNIAVSLVADALAKPDADFLIISADSDLTPAIRRIRHERPDQFVVAAFPPKRFSNELRKLMPASFQIADSKITRAQLPDVVVDHTADCRYARPKYWR